ncbi:putative membrane protein YphA (DoxX/SURF4 family) [Actinomycetospora cinnamomea]|uniref:Putative membrane protein YphA (DoxX/SURF4 family) n=1 Tax=Actinomycetospora cinnamomea TaxID=663609 RepID=A0A2U1FG45_9PSEU|nr:DoxX family protein [Actinomycetospora cinnamomea]PVZ10940.1 putative membrane protein YphA (DoxX/SURF4 family) [Actinomycetospora cinnamomea]
MLIRRLARPMLAAIFIKGGVDTLLNPEPRVQKASPLIEKASPQLPDQIPSEPSELVRIDAGVKVAAGTLLAINKFPRVASLALAASVIPTTIAGHPFWEKSDPTEKAGEQQQFLKNVAILGGLVLAAVDTEGKPSLGWRGRRAARKLAERTSELTSSNDGAGDKFRDAGDKVRRNVVDGVDVAIGALAS